MGVNLIGTIKNKGIKLYIQRWYGFIIGNRKTKTIFNRHRPNNRTFRKRNNSRTAENSKRKIFLSWEDDNNRKHMPDAPIGHFKAYYKSVIDGNLEPILLDLLYTPNPYPEVCELPIKHPWLSTSKEETIITMPTFGAILGDKLTAFAPKTTGILYSKNRPVEIIKQLYDIAFLFDKIAGIEIVRRSYIKVVQEEIEFRKLELTATEVLEDTWHTCYVLAERDMKSKSFIICN